MAHWRDGGIGNTFGSDDRPIEEWTLLEKLAEIVNHPVRGMTRPRCLGEPDFINLNLRQIASDAFDEIVRLRAVDVKLRLTEGHYRDALQLLGETRNEVTRFAALATELAEKAEKGGGA